MKNSVLLLMLLGTVSSLGGCGQSGNVPEIDDNTDKSEVQNPTKGHTPLHHEHAHAFADPAERAKKWNDPERDKWQHPEEIVAALALRPGATVADIGAGTGYMVAHLSKAVGAGGTVFAIDASIEMVDYLMDRREEMGPARIEPRKVAMDDPELESDSLNAVLTLDTWHHVSDREKYAKKIYEGLKPNGRFVVVDYDVNAEVGPPREMRLKPEEVRKQLESAGFRVEIVAESMPRHYIVVGYKE